MRLISVARRAFATAGIAALVTAGLAAGPAAPAFAEPDLTVRMTAECGSVVLTFGEATPGLPGILNVTVLRDGVEVESATVDHGGSRRYGASHGDTFTIQFGGGHPTQNLVYRVPTGCSDELRLMVVPSHDCHGVGIRLIKTGDVPATGLKVASPVGPLLDELDPVTGYITDLHYRLPDGAPYAVFSGDIARDPVLWVSGVYRQPEECGSESVTVVFTDSCEGVQIDLTNHTDGTIPLEVLINGTVVASPSLGAGDSDVVAAPAVAGDSVVVQEALLGNEIARHTVEPGECPSATPSPGGDGSTAPSPGGDGSAAPSPGGTGGLPVTGGPILPMLGAAALILAAGVAMLLVTRRRGTTAG